MMNRLIRRQVVTAFVCFMGAIPFTGECQGLPPQLQDGLPVPHGAKALSDECRIGHGTAATLLVPYFEYDPHSNLNTLVAVGNAENSQLARVVVWTDWGIPTLAFDIFLTSGDIQTFALRDLFNGVIPSTGEGVNLTGEGFAYCDVLPPNHTNPILDSSTTAQLVAMHQGKAIPGTNYCAGEPHGDDLVRGFITIDVVDECSGVEAPSPIYTPANTTYPYFSDAGGSSGIATTDNVLWGDMLFIDDDNNAAQGTELVSIHANPTAFSGNRIYTFYGRYSHFDGRDHRVPLPADWVMRFFNGGPYSGSAGLTIWRDSGVADINTVPCGSAPSWYPLLADFFVRDEDAQVYDNAPATTAPAMTQKVNVSDLNIPIDFGFIFMHNPTNQAWAEPSLGALGRFSVSINGLPVDELCGITAPP